MIEKFYDGDAYAKLGVGRRATPDEIRRAYRQAMRLFHPDQAGGDDSDPVAVEAKNRIAASLNAAYDQLKEPERRRRYDRHRGYDVDPDKRDRKDPKTRPPTPPAAEEHRAQTKTGSAGAAGSRPTLTRRGYAIRDAEVKISKRGTKYVRVEVRLAVEDPARFVTVLVTGRRDPLDRERAAGVREGDGVEFTGELRQEREAWSCYADTFTSSAEGPKASAGAAGSRPTLTRRGYAVRDAEVKISKRGTKYVRVEVRLAVEDPARFVTVLVTGRRDPLDRERAAGVREGDGVEFTGELRQEREAWSCYADTFTRSSKTEDDNPF